MNHIEINVFDLATSRQFYQPIFEQLGWTLYQDWPEGFSYQKDGWYLVFVQVKSPYQQATYHRKQVGLNHLALQVPSETIFNQLVASLRQQEVTELYADRFPQAADKEHLTFYVEDPNGIKLELICAKPAPTKASSGKVRHRYRKALATIPFYVDHQGAKAIIFWQKSNALVIKAGAKLLLTPPLNKDGSLGFAARFALSLREEHKDSISKDGVTTADIVLKSVNEVGHFLYFAGTNSWLVLKDESGKSLDAYSR